MNRNLEILEKVSQGFSRDTFFIPVIGSEIEFYLFGNVPDDIIQKIHIACVNAGVFVNDVTKEKGNGQYEVSIKHTADVLVAAKSILNVRKAICNLAIKIGVRADFSPKPIFKDYGSALHIHISLLDKNSVNVMQKDGEEECLLMKNAIAGLLELMPASVKYIAISENDYERFLGEMDSPSTISWGGNNRTVALRLPTTSSNPEDRRIEYRLASANADPYTLIACVLAGINYGITNNLVPNSDKIYGDASLHQYGLQKIPASIKEASMFFDDYLEKIMD